MLDPLAPAARLTRLAAATVLASALALPAAAQDTAQPADAPIVRSAPMTFAPLAKTQLQTVVNISTSQPAPGGGGQRLPDMPSFPPGSPFNEFFKEFRERQQQQQQQQKPATALGSGFIIDPAGFVATNHHVVADASEIAVILHDGQRLAAKLVGSDPLTDLAVLKVEPKQPLPATRWGDSDKMEVGDWVVAIGNPFGLGGSVTAGILSARQRDIHQGPYDDYIQTDAAINRGNSGGPLYNLAGEVIGINTAIYSPTGGSVGIGFAIPSALARPLIEQLKDRGEVRRGWLGVQIQQVSQDLAESLNVSEQKGALVTSVTPGGPAEKAGIRQGDVILTFAGRDIEKMRQLPRVVAATEPGKPVDVKLMREGREESIKVTVGEMEPETQMAAAGSSGPTPPRGSMTSEKALGLTLAPITPDLRETFEIDADAEGVVVAEVSENSAASARGIEAGDVIVEIGQEPVKKPEDVLSKIRSAREQGRKTVLMLVSRHGDLRYVPVSIEGRG
ncbi:MAG TPA: DegQ family serine endoprotease [Azospirillum sp.]|nr:DegQ family serine endoprotease [Azospirillum sp.]